MKKNKYCWINSEEYADVLVQNVIKKKQTEQLKKMYVDKLKQDYNIDVSDDENKGNLR